MVLGYKFIRRFLMLAYIRSIIPILLVIIYFYTVYTSIRI